MNRTITTAGLAGSLILGSMLAASPASAWYSGAVTKKECTSSRYGMSKGYLENTVYGAKGIVTHRGTGWKTLSYRASKSWDQTSSGVGVRYYFSSPEGKWRVWDVTCIFVKPLGV